MYALFYNSLLQTSNNVIKLIGHENGKAIASTHILEIFTVVNQSKSG